MDADQVTPPETEPTPPEATQPGDAIAVLQKELGEAKAKAAEYLDGWQRARAEMTNYKKRVEKEQAEAQQLAAGRILARYLDIQDDFDRALREPPAEGEAAKWVEGIACIYRKFQNVLAAEGVTRIEAEGQAFDPNLHEAVTHEECEGHASGYIIAVVREGYKLGERVLRPAMVRVAK